MIGFYILIGAISLISWLVSNQLKKKFKKYSQVQLRNGMSGAEIATKMLADNGIFNALRIHFAKVRNSFLYFYWG